MRVRLRAGLLALATALALVAGPGAAEDSVRVPTVTRLVKLFLDKEASLAAAVREGDGTALGSLLADDFELRTGANAASPVPRAEWMREVLRTREPGGSVSGMAVHDFGVVAVVSFTQGGARGPMLVVDVWKQSADGWKLAIRYASPAGAPDFPIPGGIAIEPQIPKKY
jgi:hypothetical protein